MEAGNTRDLDKESFLIGVGRWRAPSGKRRSFIEPPFHNQGRAFDLLQPVFVGFAFVWN
jgi:hypothetical protein